MANCTQCTGLDFDSEDARNLRVKTVEPVERAAVVHGKQRMATSRLRFN